MHAAGTQAWADGVHIWLLFGEMQARRWICHTCSYGPARPDGDAMLATAMAADSGRGGGAADPFAGLNIEFKEVRWWLQPAMGEAVQQLRGLLSASAAECCRHA